jgi:hypothetical protein
MRCVTITSAVLLFALSSLQQSAFADFNFQKLSSAQSAAYDAGFRLCFSAKERLPQIPAIRRAPNTVGDIGGVTDVKFQNGELWIYWNIKNIYRDKSLRVVLKGTCILTEDGKELKRILVKD